MIKDKTGKAPVGQSLKGIGFLIIAIGGGYASLTKDFRIGSLIISIGAVIIAIGEFL